MISVPEGQWAATQFQGWCCLSRKYTQALPPPWLGCLSVRSLTLTSSSSWLCLTSTLYVAGSGHGELATVVLILLCVPPLVEA